jgi:curved DNA-binding protein CbpA
MAVRGWKPPTLYDLLEAPRDSTSEELKKARSLLLAIWHPNNFHGSALIDIVTARAAEIEDAYKRLSDTMKRRAYDDTLPSPELEVNAFPDALQRIPSVWKRMAAWMKDENVGDPFHRKMAFSAGDLLERRREPSAKQRMHMLAAWDLAIAEGFDPENEEG